MLILLQKVPCTTYFTRVTCSRTPFIACVRHMLNRCDHSVKASYSRENWGETDFTHLPACRGAGLPRFQAALIRTLLTHIHGLLFYLKSHKFSGRRCNYKSRVIQIKEKRQGNRWSVMGCKPTVQPAGSGTNPDVVTCMSSRSVASVQLCLIMIIVIVDIYIKYILGR